MWALPRPGIEPCPLHCKADTHVLDQQGSPTRMIFERCCEENRLDVYKAHRGNVKLIRSETVHFSLLLYLCTQSNSQSSIHNSTGAFLGRPTLTTRLGQFPSESFSYWWILLSSYWCVCMIFYLQFPSRSSEPSTVPEAETVLNNLLRMNSKCLRKQLHSL